VAYEGQQQGPALERPALELPNVPELPRQHDKLHEPALLEPPPYAKRARLAEHEEGRSSTILGNYSGLSGKLYRAWDAQDDAFEGEGGHGQHGSPSMQGHGTSGMPLAAPRESPRDRDADRDGDRDADRAPMQGHGTLGSRTLGAPLVLPPVLPNSALKAPNSALEAPNSALTPVVLSPVLPPCFPPCLPPCALRTTIKGVDTPVAPPLAPDPPLKTTLAPAATSCSSHIRKSSSDVAGGTSESAASSARESAADGINGATNGGGIMSFPVSGGSCSGGSSCHVPCSGSLVLRPYKQPSVDTSDITRRITEAVDSPLALLASCAPVAHLFTQM
jgi:hypothetical protein